LPFAVWKRRKNGTKQNFTIKPSALSRAGKAKNPRLPISRRFICTTDSKQAQIASFYPGAMTEARDIELQPVADRVGGLDLVVIGANDPDAMVRHTQECRFRGVPFAADPSQQLARMEGPEIRTLVDGAAYLFTNEYEAALTEQKTGWTGEEILERVQMRVTTLGPKGAMVERRGEPAIFVHCPQEERRADPTGVGDAFRSGFLAGVEWGMSPERCCQIGSMLATYVIETVGTQEYDLGHADLVRRLRDAYGDDAADEIGARVRCPHP
jgi:adenosine kinase